MRAFYLIWLAVLGFLLPGCFKDKGNYTYTEQNKITIENIPTEIDVLMNVDTLKLNPKIVSSEEGEIAEGNENYSYVYASDGKVETGKMNYVALDSSYPKNLKYFVKLAPKDYNFKFIVTDKRSGVQTVKPFKLKVKSSVSQGWMVLCNEGEAKRVRLDMISVVSETRTAQAFDIGKTLGLPEIQNARKLCFEPNFFRPKIGILTDDYGYNLEAETLGSGKEYNMLNDFGNKKENCKPQTIRSSTSYMVAVDGVNNAYALNASVAGPAYGFPVNTTQSNRLAEFKVSEQFVGDPRVTERTGLILFYDITNKRFMEWSQGHEFTTIPISAPAMPIFDYNTGKNLVYMEATKYGDATAYSLLEKNGQYSLYGITFIKSGTYGKFEQSYYADLNIPDLNQAKYFAFHSTLPLMFYAIGSKIYQFDLFTKEVKLMLTLNSNEKLTMLKFNLFRYDYRKATDELTLQYLNQQYNLILGITDNNLPEKSNGILRFYNVPPLNAPLTIAGPEYKGFAEIVDVKFRERP